MSEADTYELLSAEENEEYSKNLSYPGYIVTYTAGENEDTREWTVFVMDTDICTYLYGFCAPPMLRRIWMRPIKIFFRSCI